jgi:hypothetical protein
MWMRKQCPVYLFIIPLLWSLVGFSAAFFLGIKEDTGLLIAGIVAAVLLQIKNKRKATFVPA